jgi:hypothetical protein
MTDVVGMTEKKAPHVEGKVSPTHGFDGAGHMDPAHRKHLLELAREGKSAEGEAFVKKARTNDDLAEELGEAAVASMNSGEEQLTTDLEAEVAEERGGPFVKTTAGTEFAEGTDESNIPEATREPFPTT